MALGIPPSSHPTPLSPERERGVGDSLLSSGPRSGTVRGPKHDLAGADTHGGDRCCGVIERPRRWCRRRVRAPAPGRGPAVVAATRPIPRRSRAVSRALGVPAGPPAAALDPGPGGAGRRPRRPWGGRSQAGRPRPPTPGDSAGIGLGCSVQRQVGAVEDPHGPSLGWPAGLCRMGQQAGRGRRNRWDIARADRTTLGWCTCGTPTTCRGLASRQSPGLPGSDWDTYLRRHCTAITGWLGRDERQSQCPAGRLCASAHPNRAEEAQRSLRWRCPDRQALVRHRPMVVGSGGAGEPSRRMAAHPGAFSSPWVTG
jgi:hypothetical protein